MAKRKRVKRATRRTVYKTTNKNSLTILLMVVALLVFVMAVITLSGGRI
jgi:high-affinity K+ transport system ATPase subunit B